VLGWSISHAGTVRTVTIQNLFVDS